MNISIKDLNPKTGKLFKPILFSSAIFASSIFLARYIRPYILVGIFLLCIFAKILETLLRKTFPWISTLKNKYLSVGLITLLLFILPIGLGFLFLLSIASFSNNGISKINQVLLYFIYFGCTSSIAIFLFVKLKSILEKTKSIMKSSSYIMAAVFGTAYGMLDILNLNNTNEYIKAAFFGVFVAVLFSRVIIEW